MLDASLYITADRDAAFAEELMGFYETHQPLTFFHAVVAQELLQEAVDARRAEETRKNLMRPFEARGRVITPTFAAWARSGEVVAALVRPWSMRAASVTRSFLNDVVLAMSCREVGVTLVTRKLADFERIRRVAPFDFVGPWPRG